MEQGQNPYDYFMAAFEREVVGNWKGKRKLLADKINISVPYLSEIVNRKKKAGLDVQGRVCNVLGIKYEEFIAIGRKLLLQEETSENGENTPNNQQLITNQDHAPHAMTRVFPFNRRETDYKIDKRLQTIINDLIFLYKHSNNEAIELIEDSLRLRVERLSQKIRGDKSSG